MVRPWTGAVGLLQAGQLSVLLQADPELPWQSDLLHQFGELRLRIWDGLGLFLLHVPYTLSGWHGVQRLDVRKHLRRRHKLEWFVMRQHLPCGNLVGRFRVFQRLRGRHELERQQLHERLRRGDHMERELLHQRLRERADMGWHQLC